MSKRSSLHAIRLYVALLSLPLVGCGFFQNAYHVEPVVVSQRPGINRCMSTVWEPFRQAYRYAAGYPVIDVVDLDEFKFPAGTQPAYALATINKSDRDQLIWSIVKVSNDVCMYHVSGFVSQQSFNELVMGAAMLGLTGGASVVGNIDTAQNLAAAATGVGGFRTLSGNAVYYRQVTPVLAARALASRGGVLQQIAAKMQIYSLDRMADGSACPNDWCMPRECDAGKKLKDLAVEALAEAEKELDKAEGEHGKAKKAADAKPGPEEQKKLDDARLAVGKALEIKTSAKAAADKAREGKFMCRPWQEYPISQAIGELSEFHDSCSFYKALQQAESDIRAKTEDISKSMDKIYEDALKRAQSNPVLSPTDDSGDSE